MNAHPPLPAELLIDRVVAVARRVPLDALLVAADILAGSGLRVIEVTMDSPDALAAIERLSGRGSSVGAGTVMTLAQARDAASAGARFLVSPVTDPTLVRWGADRSLPFIPGAFTPTEVTLAWAAGAAAVKVFPASAAGPALVREMRGPLGHIPLVPSGGVTLDTAAGFLTAGAVAVGLGGSLLCPDPAELRHRADRAAALRAP